MDDALDVLEWRNDPQSVAVSKTGAVGRVAHLAWFSKAIADSGCALFMAEEDGRKLGMIRFDHSDEAWIVNINLAPTERGKGYGEEILRAGMAKIGSVPLLAEIKADNLASICIFERCGFQCSGNEDGWLRYASFHIRASA